MLLLRARQRHAVSNLLDRRLERRGHKIRALTRSAAVPHLVLLPDHDVHTVRRR